MTTRFYLANIGPVKLKRYANNMQDTPASPSATFRTAIITGGNTGLGYVCASNLLHDASGGSPWNVVIACRDPERAQDAVKRLRQEVNAAGSSAKVEAMRLDLASFKSVRDFTEEIGRRLDTGELAPVHALVCNAGIQRGATKTFTVDGFERTFGVNHLGHFLLVNLLVPRLALPARIAVVASGTHDPAQKTGMPVPAWNDPTALAKGVNLSRKSGQGLGKVKGNHLWTRQAKANGPGAGTTRRSKSRRWRWCKPADAALIKSPPNWA